MGTYYHLSCKECRQYVHFGKKLHEDSKGALQGMYSEKNHSWVNDERIWDALQSFLLEHQGHTLVFDNDANDMSIDDYVEVELDHLLKIG
jgi:hypothetical protein